MRMSFRNVGLATMSLVAGLAFGVGIAQAAPQSLALVATNGKIDLTCQDGQCGAEFSSFCLQFDRFSPTPGTPYRLAGGDIRVVGTTKDGREVALDARRVLRFESLRRHVALRISVAHQRIDSLGLASVAVAVGENVTLLPSPEPGDVDRDTDADLAVLGHSLRPLGSLIVDGNRTRMAAARITNRMINALPARSGADAGNALWRRAKGGAESEGAAMGAVVMARKAFEFCRFAASRATLGGLRRCLQSEHDGFLDFLNSAYWKAVKTGS